MIDLIAPRFELLRQLIVAQRTLETLIYSPSRPYQANRLPMEVIAPESGVLDALVAAMIYLGHYRGPVLDPASRHFFCASFIEALKRLYREAGQPIEDIYSVAPWQFRYLRDGIDGYAVRRPAVVRELVA